MSNPLDIEFENMNGEMTTLRMLADPSSEHWIVVNVASACGFTKQYTDLQACSACKSLNHHSWTILAKDGRGYRPLVN